MIKEQRMEKKDRKKYIVIALIVVLAAAAFGWYSYNLPARRLERALKKADALLEQQSFEEASAAYEQAQNIDGVSPEALEGQILAEMGKADKAAAEAVDIPSRSQACDLYEHVMQLCSDALAAVQNPEDARFTQPGSEAETKRDTLQKGIAADYVQAEYTRETVDRSGSVDLPDGTKIPYSQYYDLVQIEDQYYPYAETINAALKQGMDDYFADPENDISAGITGRGAAAKDGTYRDYVGVQGVYADQGLLSIRMAHVRIIGDSQTNDYCGVTFRLSDCAQLSLEDIAGVTDIGLRRMVRRRIWSWFEQEGYSDIKKSDIEDYVEEIDPSEFKYSIRDDGTVCLIIDQTAPFFEDRQEILEIPLDTEPSD